MLERIDSIKVIRIGKIVSQMFEYIECSYESQSDNNDICLQRGSVTRAQVRKLLDDVPMFLNREWSSGSLEESIWKLRIAQYYDYEAENEEKKIGSSKDAKTKGEGGFRMNLVSDPWKN